jgi:acyl-CoA synthetase (AMP-forming)/AMP-acid ligase II
MLGYVGISRDETLDADGFFHTGDGGYLDEAGRLFWEGRLTHDDRQRQSENEPAALLRAPGHARQSVLTPVRSN